MDDDGGVNSVQYQWFWRTLGTTEALSCGSFITGFEETDTTNGDPDIVNTASVPGTAGNTSNWMKIDSETGSSYTPGPDRADDYDTAAPRPTTRDEANAAFDCLMVRAKYLDDGQRPDNDDATPNYDESFQHAYAISEFAVQLYDTDNAPPRFRDGDTALAGKQVRTRIQENFTAGTEIFSAVDFADSTNSTEQDTSAGDFLTDPADPDVGVIRILDGTYLDTNGEPIDPFEAGGVYTSDDIQVGTGHKLTFHISGTDAEHFELVDKATGAINFLASPDYEERAERRYSIMLTAHDPTDKQDSIEIIVDVEDDNELPTITEGKTKVPFKENSSAVVETYEGHDPESDDFYWGLTGPDAVHFDLGRLNGELTFRKAPNYEDPQDAGNDNVYNVEVNLLLDGEDLLPSPAPPPVCL